MEKKEKLERYVAGEIKYTPLLNIFLNNRSKDWYKELGKFIVDNVDLSQCKELEFFADKVKKSFSLKKFLGGTKRIYITLSIHFLTEVLGKRALEKMFGRAIYHSEFGEGFESTRAKHSYASYFVKIGETNLHIGYDHRGTGIEIEVNPDFNFEYNKIPEKTAEEVLESLKSLVILWRDKHGISMPKEK